MVPAGFPQNPQSSHLKLIILRVLRLLRILREPLAEFSDIYPIKCQTGPPEGTSMSKIIFLANMKVFFTNLRSFFSS
jgi:hypothetical protein